jgi:hypothetical protein
MPEGEHIKHKIARQEKGGLGFILNRVQDRLRRGKGAKPFPALRPQAISWPSAFGEAEGGLKRSAPFAPLRLRVKQTFFFGRR